jgi:deoxycytidylate deaminase
MKPTKLLDIALGVALGRLNHKQKWKLGAAGIRSDGVIVVSFNGAPKEPEWTAHSESRLCKKLTPNSVVAVVRVLANGEPAMAKPCPNCERCLQRVGVKKVYYSIGPKEFGVLSLS